MKKLALLAALSMVSASAMADAVVGLENWTAGTTITVNGKAPTADVFFTLTGPGGLVYASGDKTQTQFTVGKADLGNFDVGTGVIPGVTGGQAASLKWDLWTAAGEKASVSWSQATADWNPAAVPPTPAIGPAGTFPNVNLVAGTVPPIPEPSTIALGMIGAAALLLRRRS